MMQRQRRIFNGTRNEEKVKQHKEDGLKEQDVVIVAPGVQTEVPANGRTVEGLLNENGIYFTKQQLVRVDSRIADMEQILQGGEMISIVNKVQAGTMVF